jgi:curved DNA-binding protein
MLDRDGDQKNKYYVNTYMKDYYKILGVDKSAAPSEIKSAYKNLAKKNHPDAGGDPAQFQKLNEAYSTLKDPARKAAYDEPLIQDPFRRSSGFGGTQYQQSDEINLNDIFGQAFRQQRTPARGRDINIKASVFLKDVLTGKHIIASYSLLNGERESVEVEIPKGVHNGMKVRYVGLGDIGPPNAPRGDLYVIVEVQEESGWARDGNDLVTEINVDALDMILGTSTNVTMLDNRQIKLRILAGSKNGCILSIPEHGLTDINTGKPGRLLIKVTAVIPKITNDEARTKLQEAQKLIRSNC